MNRACAVIPAYNEGKNLSNVLRNIKNHGIDVIIVDDGSSDNTTAIAEDHKAHLIRHSSNEGKGRALRDGLSFALDRGYDLIITLDADGQHDTDEIPSFMKAIEKNDGDIVIGNRLHDPAGMPRYRLFINRLFSKITSLACGQNIPDSACGYRIIKRKVLESIRLESDKFDIDPEIIIKSAKAGFNVGFMDIKCIYAGEASHIRPFEYWNNFFRLIIRELKNN